MKKHEWVHCISKHLFSQTNRSNSFTYGAPILPKNTIKTKLFNTLQQY